MNNLENFKNNFKALKEQVDNINEKPSIKMSQSGLLEIKKLWLIWKVI